MVAKYRSSVIAYWPKTLRLLSFKHRQNATYKLLLKVDFNVESEVMSIKLLYSVEYKLEDLNKLWMNAVLIHDSSIIVAGKWIARMNFSAVWGALGFPLKKMDWLH